MDDDTKARDDKLATDMAALGKLEENIPGPHKRGIGLALEGGGLVLAIIGIVLVVIVTVLVIMVLAGVIK
jgi:hypothetical protein